MYIGNPTFSASCSTKIATKIATNLLRACYDNLLGFESQKDERRNVRFILSSRYYAGFFEHHWQILEKHTGLYIILKLFIEYLLQKPAFTGV